ncbi:conserved hypothetical protein [Ricinus communis]|uniref:Uncharacterized protein n=1 Tax=Ricinus communis TaxID=3988 RepID=B9RVI7_RICCO|nr:conserved hypothetical protein [Ricinus communis]
MKQITTRHKARIENAPIERNYSECVSGKDKARGRNGLSLRVYKLHGKGQTKWQFTKMFGGNEINREVVVWDTACKD